MRWAVKEGAVLPALFEIAFSIEDFHHGHDAGVSDFAVLEECLVHIADGGGAALPHELHDFEFLGSQRVAWLSHSTLLVLTNSYVKRKDSAEKERGLRIHTLKGAQRGVTSPSALCDSYPSMNSEKREQEKSGLRDRKSVV